MGHAEQRSQPIMRLPRDHTPVALVMHDGTRANVTLFVPPGDHITQVLENSDPFLPVSSSTGTRLIARSAIACITIRNPPAPSEDDLPVERQRAIVRLRGGGSVEGELRWIASPGRRRTLDHLNDGSSHLEVYNGDEISYVVKAHVVAVEET